MIVKFYLKNQAVAFYLENLLYGKDLSKEVKFELCLGMIGKVVSFSQLISVAFKTLLLAALTSPPNLLETDAQKQGSAIPTLWRYDQALVSNEPPGV